MGRIEWEAKMTEVGFRSDTFSIEAFLNGLNGVEMNEKSEEMATTSPPPDGGTLAWLQVLGSFFLWMSTL